MYDAEYKIFEKAAEALDSIAPAARRGRLDIYVEARGGVMCGSCSAVMTAFKAAYPRVQVNVYVGLKIAAG